MGKELFSWMMISRLVCVAGREQPSGLHWQFIQIRLFLPRVSWYLNKLLTEMLRDRVIGLLPVRLIRTG